MRRLLLPLLICTLSAGLAHAGHELSFYPSYYPQEIRIERLAPAAAVAGLEQKTLHAYVGGDPYGGRPAPAHVAFVDSLAGYLALTLDPARAARQTAEARCAAARSVVAALASGPHAGYVFHPYPVTPHHPDYLQHADLVQVARSRVATPPATPPLRVRAVGAAAERALAGRWPAASGEWDATLEAVDLPTLLAPRTTSLDGWLGPPWVKEGWFHAYLLESDRLVDATARQAVEALVARLTRGEYSGAVERLNLERELVMRLGAGCERVVVGYTVRREPFNAEFSAGIENVGADGHAGLESAIFVRTAKLKDFPWNGWLNLATPARATAAWNPVGGFTDPTGRLVWAALGDPAFFPAPRSGGWIGNRVTVASVTPVTEVPKGALLPEPGTGMLREVGRAGTPAAVKIVYRVLASAFHDGTRMAVADTLAALGFAYRWGAPGGPRHDAGVEAATARLRDWLAGLKVVGVETSEREYGEVKFTSIVQTIEVYGRYRLADDLQTASIAPPWSAVPWTVLALAERAVTSKLAAFSEGEARRLGVPWLDLARDPRVVGLLARAADGGGFLPAELAGQVTEAEARERWAALLRFYQQHKHVLVTNGPYRLESWSDDGVVLGVFRDFTYPLGVGSYDRYPIPVRAYPARLERQGDRVEVQADVDVVEKFQREYRVTRQPLSAAAVDQPDLPVCRYVAVGPDHRIVAAGIGRYAGRGTFAIDLGGLPPARPLTLVVALVVRDNALDLETGTLVVGAR